MDHNITVILRKVEDKVSIIVAGDAIYNGSYSKDVELIISKYMEMGYQLKIKEI